MSDVSLPPWMRPNTKVLARFLQKKPNYIAAWVKYSTGKKIRTDTHFVVFKGDARYESYLLQYHRQTAGELMLEKELGK